MSLPITSFTAAALIPLFIWLAFQVINFRKSKQISLGDGAEPELLTKTRAHGNFAEYAPISLILLALLEGNGTAGWAVALIAACVILGRYIHAVSFLKGKMNFKLRTIGMVLTFVALAISAIILLVQSLF